MTDTPARAILAIVSLTCIGLGVAHVQLRTELAELRGRMHATTAPPLASIHTLPRPLDQPNVEPVRAPRSTPPAIAPRAHAPSAELDEWSCTATIPTHAVTTALARQAAPALACVRAAAENATGPPSIVEVLARIDDDGKVSATHVKGTRLPTLQRCLGEAILSWDFPAPDGDGCAVVALPFAVGR